MVDGPEILTVDEFARRFDAGELDRSHLHTFAVELPGDIDFGTDPLAAPHAEGVMATWRRVTGRTTYSAEVDEAFDIDQALHSARPYPYVSGDPVEVGRYIGAMAWFMREVKPRPGDRVAEYGSGWGHLALMMASLGCVTTAVDLNPGSVELLRRRAERQGVPLEVIRGDFTEVSVESSDLVVFFESFHHSARPFVLLDNVAAMLTEGGRLVLLADAVYSGFSQEWGVRLDGDAAFMARATGWLELGFERSFFIGELRRRGLHVLERVAPELGPYGQMIIAEKRAVDVGLDFVLPEADEATWDPLRLPGLPGRFTTERSEVALPDAAATVEVEVALRNLTSAEIRVMVLLGEHGSQVVLAPGAATRCALPVGGARSLVVRSDIASSDVVGGRGIGVLVESATLLNP
jgi:SAM-dependent methyltransferase